MVFIETRIFTEDVNALLSDEDYSALQQHLVSQADAGDIVAGTGGTRVIYYHVVAQAQIRMVLIYRKGIKDDLGPKEKTMLRKINAEW
jgi:predicted secreted protein